MGVQDFNRDSMVLTWVFLCEVDTGKSHWGVVCEVTRLAVSPR
jgi:hypothetical protein